MKVKLKLFYKWGIEFDKMNPYTVKDNGNRKVEYAEKKDIVDGIMQKYQPELFERVDDYYDSFSGGQMAKENNEVKRSVEKKSKNKSGIKTVPPSKRRVQKVLREVNANEPI